MEEYPECVEKFTDRDQLEIDTSKVNPQEAAWQIISRYHLI